MFRRAPDTRWIPLAVFTAIVILIVGFIIFEHNLKPTIMTIAEAEARLGGYGGGQPGDQG